MQILGLLDMYFDAVVVEVKTFALYFRLALAILCNGKSPPTFQWTNHALLCNYRTIIGWFMVNTL